MDKKYQTIQIFREDAELLRRIQAADERRPASLAQLLHWLLEGHRKVEKNGEEL